MKDFLQAFALIFIAEMGDKTQIMAMAFATKYKIKHILIGVMIGSFLNHGLAIFLGSILTNFIPIEALQLIAGVLFIAFGLVSLSIAEEVDEEVSSKRFGAIITVAIAFFLGELGDKTQLTALTLSTQSTYQYLTLLGTVSGMVVVSSLGIFVGAKLGDKIPEHIIKVMAFLIFMFFGLNKTFQSDYVQSMGGTFIAMLAGIIILLTIFRSIIFVRQLKEISISALKQKAEDLKNYRTKIKNQVDNLCKNCDICRGSRCVVGYMRDLLSNKLNGGAIDAVVLEKLHDEGFDAANAKIIIDLLEEYYKLYPEEINANIELIDIKRLLGKIIEKNTIRF